MTEYRKKLIEVALPLTEVNDASAYDKLPGIGAHPKNMHQWWARLPCPPPRAVLFASIIDDPSANPEFVRKSKEVQDPGTGKALPVDSKASDKKTDPGVVRGGSGRVTEGVRRRTTSRAGPVLWRWFNPA